MNDYYTTSADFLANCDNFYYCFFNSAKYNKYGISWTSTYIVIYYIAISMPKSKLYAWKCSCGTNMKWLGKLKGGGGSSSIFWKTRYWDNNWPKKYTQWATFLAGFWAPRPNCADWKSKKYPSTGPDTLHPIFGKKSTTGTFWNFGQKTTTHTKCSRFSHPNRLFIYILKL